MNLQPLFQPILLAPTMKSPHFKLVLPLLSIATSALAAEFRGFFNRGPVPGSLVFQPSAVDWMPDGRIADFSNPKPTDGIEILHITPQKVATGTAQEVTVRIRYSLNAAPKGVIALGFNVGSSTTIRLMQRRWITKGQGEMELTTTIEPVRWPDGRPLKAYVNLSTDAHPTKRSSLASHVTVLKFK